VRAVNPNQDVEWSGATPRRNVDDFAFPGSRFALDPNPGERQGERAEGRPDNEPLEWAVASPAHQNSKGDSDSEPNGKQYQ
jgi:hypothetical protein